MQGVVGVLLRVDDPDHQVDEPHQTVDLQTVSHRGAVMIGKVQQDESVEVDRPAGGLRGRQPVSARHPQPVEKLVTAFSDHQPGGLGRRWTACPDRGDLGAAHRVEE
jgi:hypothetical protein